MRKPVLLLDQGETMGGAERFLVDFCNALTSADLRRINPIIVGAKVPAYRDMLAENIDIQPFHFPGIRGSIFQKPLIILKVLWAAWRLDRLIKQQKAKVVFSNTPRTHLVMWAAVYFFDTKVDWHVMIHDFTTPKWLLRSIGKMATTIDVNSMGTREDTRQKIKPSHYDKIRIIENGVDIQKLPDPKPSTAVQKILIIGRIDRRKGQNYSLEVARIMKDKHPTMHFFVVGIPFEEDPRTIEFYKELKDYVKRYDLTNVTFVGEAKDPFDAYLGADVVLFTPIDPEPFGRVTIEGLAMGKLVLAFNETGPREVLQQFRNFCAKSMQESDLEPIEKILPPSCDVASLASSLEYFSANPERMKPYTKNARKFINEHFPLSETKKRILQLFEG